MLTRKKLIAANWKMHGSQTLAQLMGTTLLMHSKEWEKHTDVALFPPCIYIPYFAEHFSDSIFSYGAQNIAEYKQGAYTGEISAAMVAEFGCQYTLVGHSERRSLYHETSKMVARKFAMIQAYGVTPILCVGETLAEQEAGKTFDVICEQLTAVLALPVGIKGLEHAVIAYEPVWAIGTGKTATPEQAQAIHQQIRDYLATYEPAIAQKIQILYGGSVKPENARALAEMPDIDGFLVGGASLEPQQFLEIIKCSCS